MVTPEQIRAYSFEEAWQHVIDPWMLRAYGGGDSVALSPRVADLIAVWILQGCASRSGLSSFVAEEPPWLVARVASAARSVDLAHVADLWERATASMDLASLSGTSEFTWASPESAEALQRSLVIGDPVDVPQHLVAFVQAHAEDFALA